jgi:small subunit ribosomal protein S5e
MEIVRENYQIKEQPKLFGKWDYSEVTGHSEALDNYIAVKDVKSQVYVPHTAGRYQIKHLKKATMPIVERLVGSLLFHGRNAGKKIKAINVVDQAFDIINLQTGKNPINILVAAIDNCSPREDSTRIGKGGNVKR